MATILCSSFCYNQFRIDVTFKMTTFLYGICLLIDTHQIVGQHFFIKRKWRGREQDSRERGSVCVCVRQRVGKGRDSIGHKISC